MKRELVRVKALLMSHIQARLTLLYHSIAQPFATSKTVGSSNIEWEHSNLGLTKGGGGGVLRHMNLA